MESGGPANPVVQTLEELAELWEAFTSEPDPRWLRWIVDDDSRQMVETFLRTEADVGGTTPDLFLLFEEPFVSGEDFGAVLLEGLIEALDRDRDEIEAAGVPVGWKPQPPTPGATDPQIFAQAMISLAEFYSDDAEHLAVALLPFSTSDPTEWGNWLWAFLHSGLPPEVRICTVEMDHSRVLDRISDGVPELVQVHQPSIDFHGILKQLSTLAGGSGPGLNFRRHLLNLMALASRDPARLPAASAPALTIARGQKWAALEALVHFVVGGALLNAGKPKEAAAAYAESEAAVAEPPPPGEGPAAGPGSAPPQKSPGGADGPEAEAGGEGTTAQEKVEADVAKKVRFQSRMAQGSALISGKEYLEAARVFESTVPLAEDLDEAREQMIIECWRLAAFGFEFARRPEESWRCALMAFQVGEAMELEDRRNTSLPYMGLGLDRICGDLPQLCGHEGLELWIQERLGPDWRELVVPGEATR